MNRSEQVGDLIAALAKSQSQFTPVNKNKTAKVKSQRTGGEFTYKYADLADCLSMALPILSSNGIAFSQPHIIRDGKLRVTTLLMHSSGQWMQSDGIEISEDGDPQQFGAESTYFRRYDGCSFCGIAPDEDTDAQQAGQRQRRSQPPADPVPTKTNGRAPYYASQEPGMHDEVEPQILKKENPTEWEKSEWQAAFDECGDVKAWNASVVPLMKERGREFILAAAAEAKRRGYKVNRTTGSYEDGGAK